MKRRLAAHWPAHILPTCFTMQKIEKKLFLDCQAQGLIMMGSCFNTTLVYIPPEICLTITCNACLTSVNKAVLPTTAAAEKAQRGRRDICFWLLQISLWTIYQLRCPGGTTTPKNAKYCHSPVCLCVGEGNRNEGAAEAILFQLDKNTKLLAENLYRWASIIGKPALT